MAEREFHDPIERRPSDAVDPPSRRWETPHDGSFDDFSILRDEPTLDRTYSVVSASSVTLVPPDDTLSSTTSLPVSIDAAQQSVAVPHHLLSAIPIDQIPSTSDSVWSDNSSDSPSSSSAPSSYVSNPIFIPSSSLPPATASTATLLLNPYNDAISDTASDAGRDYILSASPLDHNFSSSLSIDASSGEDPFSPTSSYGHYRDFPMVLSSVPPPPSISIPFMSTRDTTSPRHSSPALEPHTPSSLLTSSLQQYGADTGMSSIKMPVVVLNKTDNHPFSDTASGKEDGPSRKKVAPKPPIATRVPFEGETIWGHAIRDDYHWFRQKANPKVMEYLEAENTYAEAIMKHTEDLQTTLYNEFVERLLDTDAEVPVQVDNYYYYKRVEGDKQYTIHCRKYDNLDTDEEVIFDENEWAEGEDYFEIGAFEVSPNHNLVAISTNTSGDERYTCYFKDLTTTKLLDDEIPNTNTIRWGNDNQTVFYTVVHEKTGRSYRLCKHRLGTPVTEDQLVYQEDDEAFVLSISRTNSGRFMLMKLADQSTSEVRYADADDPLSPFKTLYERDPNIMYFIEHHGKKFYILTNDDGAYNFKLVQAPLVAPGKKNWREVLGHSEGVMLEEMVVFKHHLVVWALRNCSRVIKVMDLSDGEWHTVEFPDPLTSIWPGNYSDEDMRFMTTYKTNKLRFIKGSFVEPTAYFDYDMDNRTRSKKKVNTVLGGYVPSLYHQERIFAKAPDGAMVPISMMYRRDLRNEEEGNFTLLIAYGAYGGNKHPEFDSHRLSLLDRGFIYAVAHVRGSSFCGRKWYLDGKMLHKRNSFTDFIACAEHLIQHKYTSSNKLAIYGRSAGGLIMGAVLNMAPHLFKVAVVEVPFVDAINTMLDPSIPWTAFEFSEWGNPRTSKEFFDYMMSYSPYDNVKAIQYPNILITTGWNDPRVPYWEPTKWTAKLRAMKTDSNILLLKTQIAGHMGSTGRYDHLEDLAFNYAFIIDRLEVAPHVTVSKPLMKVVPPTTLAPPDLLRIFQGFQITAILYTALELGVFDQLAQLQSASCETLASKMNCSERGMRILLDALMAMGTVEVMDGNFTLSAVAAAHLVRGLPNYIGDVRHFMVNDYIWDTMRRLPNAVREGGPPLGGATAEDAGLAVPQMRQHWEDVARFNTAQMASVGAQLAALLGPWAQRHKPLSILDVGCGAGFLGFTLLQRHHHARLASLDWPNVITIARGYAEQLELGERVTFIEGDLFLTPLGGPYDLIILGQVMHQLNEEQCNIFLRRILTVLKPNGRVVIHETISGLDDANPHPQLFSVMMLIHSPEGEAYSLSWYQRMLSDAGFAPPTVHNLQGTCEKLLVTSSNLIPLRVRRKEAPKR